MPGEIRSKCRGDANHRAGQTAAGFRFRFAFGRQKNGMTEKSGLPGAQRAIFLSSHFFVACIPDPALPADSTPVRAAVRAAARQTTR